MTTDTIAVPSKRRGRPPKEKSTTDIPETQVITEAKDAQEYSVEITRDYYGQVDPFYLSKKNPEYAYRFLRDEHKNIAMKTSNLLFQKGGWQLVPKAHLLKLGIKERELSPDGFLRRGDTVLAFIPMKLYVEKEEYRNKKAQEPMEHIERLLKKGDSSVGKNIHETMKGIQTQIDLKGNWK